MEPRGTFLPRSDGTAFRSGQTIEDLYVDAFGDFLDSTAKRLQSQGFTWVELDPPWQWVEEDGLPMAKNDLGNAPNYPDDATFLRELRAYSERGIQAIVFPQLCCTALDTTGRSAAWWDAYFAETERFLGHFAALAEEGGAAAFGYAVPSFHLQEAPENGAHWSHIFAAIRARFSGEVGQMVWMLGPDVSPTPQITPQTDFIEWGSELDFFLVHSDFPLSTSDTPSDADLEAGARAVANGTRALHEEFGKPVLLRNGFFNVKNSWKGQTFYSISSIPGPEGPEAALAASLYEFDAHDHARTVQAQFEALADAPWVAGYFHFGYTHWVDPLSPWMSIRGKEPEDVWRKWNESISDEA